MDSKDSTADYPQPLTWISMPIPHWVVKSCAYALLIFRSFAKTTSSRPPDPSFLVKFSTCPALAVKRLALHFYPWQMLKKSHNTVIPATRVAAAGWQPEDGTSVRRGEATALALESCCNQD